MKAWVTASRLAARKDAVGLHVETRAFGGWPVGACEVIAVRPDPEAPEIALQVRRIVDGAEIGVFGLERVRVAERQPTLPGLRAGR